MTDLFREARRTFLRERIAYYERAAVEPKRDLNALSPFVDLPVEMISQICRLVRSDFHDKSRRKIISRQDSNVISWFDWLPGLLHVCHRWREVALDDARLWSRIVARAGMDPDFLKMQLEHSGHAPLSVTFDCRTAPLCSWSKVLPTLIPDLPRACAYLFVQEEASKDHSAVFAALVDDPAPRVHTVEHYVHSLPEGAQLTWRVPELFAGVTPALRNLTIDGPCALGWHNSIFCGSVTVLRVSNLRDVEDADPEEFLSALQRMPCLETVELAWALPPALCDLKKPDALVEPCPRLRELTLRGTVSCITAFFAHVSVPLSTSIHLHVKVNENISREWTLAELWKFRLVVAKILEESPKEMAFVGDASPGSFVCCWSFPGSPVAISLPSSSLELPDLSTARLSLHVPPSYRRRLHDIVPESAAVVLAVCEASAEHLGHRTDAGPLLAGVTRIDLYGHAERALAAILGVGFLTASQPPVWCHGSHGFRALRVLRLLDDASVDGATTRPWPDAMEITLKNGLVWRRGRGLRDLEEVAFVRYVDADASRMDWLGQYVGQVSYGAAGEPTRQDEITEVSVEANVLEAGRAQT